MTWMRYGRSQWKLSEEFRRQIIKLAAQGGTKYSIAAALGSVSPTTVWNVLSPMGGVIRVEDWVHSDARLSLDQRVEIRLGLERSLSYRAIGVVIGRAASTVCREVNANGGRAQYRPMVAHRRARRLARRPKPTKLSSRPALRRRVSAELGCLWSPQQIAQRLKAEFGDDEAMTVSHETIYKSLFVQGRGELRRELTRCLRTGRTARKSGSRLERRGRIPGMVMISERPAEAADRAVPGHWEGDLLMAKTATARSGRWWSARHDT